MRKDIKKMDNKGFSLVELIIVIAIMAILVGIIGSQVVPYIEKSRLSKDKSTVDTVYTAWQSAVAKEYTQTPSGGASTAVKLGDGSTNKTLTTAFVDSNHTSEADYNLDKEIIEAIGNGVKDEKTLNAKLTSKALKGCEFYFYYDKEAGVIAVAAQKADKATSSYCISSATAAKMIDNKTADPGTDMGLGAKSSGKK